jgi:very-short-patch-repair endonuclease
MSSDRKLDEICLAIGRQYVRSVMRWGASTPIEQLMMAALIESRLDEMSDIGERIGWPTEHIESANAWLASQGLDPNRCYELLGWYAFQQHQIGPYRVDFALVSRLAGRVVIECDGHDYHERTKEQARHDKKRDRFMLAQGWKVLRFTGSEIYADAAKCVAEVRALLESLDQAELERIEARHTPTGTPRTITKASDL